MALLTPERARCACNRALEQIVPELLQQADLNQQVFLTLPALKGGDSQATLDPLVYVSA